MRLPQYTLLSSSTKVQDRIDLSGTSRFIIRVPLSRSVVYFYIEFKLKKFLTFVLPYCTTDFYYFLIVLNIIIITIYFSEGFQYYIRTQNGVI